MNCRCLVFISCLAASAQNFPEVARQAQAARMHDQVGQAIRLYREGVRMRPAWAEGWWYLGSLLYDKNSFGEAREALTHFVKLQPDAAPGWALLGLSEYETAKYVDALAHLQHGLALGLKREPQVFQVALFHAGLLLTYTSQFEVALKAFEQLIHEVNQDPEIVTAIGLAALRMPILPPALPASQRDLVHDAGRAVFDEMARRPEEAKREFEELAAKYPDTPRIHDIYGRFLITSDPDAAVRQWREEIRVSPRDVPARVEIALEYLKRGEPEKALPFAREAAELGPGEFAAHNALGRALAETGEVSAGVAELEKARDLAPDSPETRLALARAYEKAGRAQDAARERAESVRLRKLRDGGQ